MSSIGSQRYINWDAIYAQTPELQELLSEESLTKCQNRITDMLKDVHPEGRPIIVTKRVISSLLFSIFDDHTHNNKHVGDIYSRHIQPNELSRNDMQVIVDKTIRTIVNDVRGEYQTVKNNQQLTVWNTVYGDFNERGLRAHPPIKLREKRVGMQFHMNY